MPEASVAPKSISDTMGWVARMRVFMGDQLPSPLSDRKTPIPVPQ